MVAEVVGFVDDYEIKVLPVEVGKIDVADFATVARKIGVGEKSISE